MNYSYNPSEPVGSKIDLYDLALGKIPDIINKEKVVTDREIKVRLEGEPFPSRNFGPFPWVTGRAIGTLLSQDVLERHGYRGRHRIGGGVPQKFYSLRGVDYSEIENRIEIKRRMSADINSVLMGEEPAGTFAEDIFLDAFLELNFNWDGKRDVSEYKGRYVRGVPGKAPPNLDYMVEKNGVTYGVDVKNWIEYEFKTRDKVHSKVLAALDLGIIPFIIARYVDREMTGKIIYEWHGVVYEYKTLILPLSLRSLANDAQAIFGYPTVAVGRPSEVILTKIEDIHRRHLRLK